MGSGGTEVLEKGHIYFFYRPRVNEEEPSSLDDVQRMYIVLKVGDVLRLLVMGRKKLPDPTKHSRPYWGFVGSVTKDPSALQEALASEDYSTKTRGTQHRPGVRVVGMGHYALLRHTTGAHTLRSHTHLVYSLDQPRKPLPEGSPQDEMKISRQGSFILQVKNPTASGGSSRGQPIPSRRTEPFPEELQKKIGSLRFIPLDPPDFLNQEGCEILVIAAADDVAAEFGGDAAEEIEHQCEELQSNTRILELLQDTKKDKEELVQPLFESAWT